MELEHISNTLDKSPTTTSVRRHKRNDKLDAERYPDETFGPAYAKGCRLCRESGFAHPPKYDGSPDYSRVVPCKCWENWKRGIPAARQAGINTVQTLENYLVLKGKNDEAHRTAWEFTKLNPKITMFLLYGSLGNGKSHLCHGVALKLRECGIHTKLITAGELLAELRKAIPDNGLETQMETVCKMPVLIIDDLKQENLTTGWALNRIEDIIDYRYNESKNGNRLHTMLTTNLDRIPHNDIPAIPPRIQSRCGDPEIGRIVLNQAPDCRDARTAREVYKKQI